jgi:hypothetical protein
MFWLRLAALGLFEVICRQAMRCALDLEIANRMTARVVP